MRLTSKDYKTVYEEFSIINEYGPNSRGSKPGYGDTARRLNLYMSLLPPPVNSCLRGRFSRGRLLTNSGRKTLRCFCYTYC